MNKKRRELIKKSAVFLSYNLGGKALLLTPEQANARQISFSVLNKEQVLLLAMLAETIVPGSKKAGVCHYLDYQLNKDDFNNLLMIRYLGVAPPYLDFYCQGLLNTQSASIRLYQKPFVKLNKQQSNELVSHIAQGKVQDWKGASSNFFYFVLRADAVDVVYGTCDGFGHLGVPYMPHILPQQRW